MHTHEKSALEDLGAALNKIMLEQTNTRIQEELSNLSADELKANIVIGAVAAISAIIGAVSFLNDFHNHLKNIMFLGFILISAASLIVSFYFAVKVVIPRKRFSLWDPRISFSEYVQYKKDGSKLDDDKIKRKIVEERVLDFEEIRDSRCEDSSRIKLAYIFLIIGSAAMFITIAVANLTI